MADQNLNIHLRLKDEFTPSLTKVQANLQQAAHHIDTFGRNISSLGTRMTVVGGIMTGGFLASMKSVSSYSPQVEATFKELGNSLVNLQVIIAQAIVPVFQQVTNVISNVAEAFSKMDPGVRNAILQWTFLSGVFLTVGGVVLKVVGSIVSIVGKIGGLLASLNPVQIAIMAIVGAVILMITYWDKVRTYVLPIINIMQIGADMVAIGWYKVVDSILFAFEKIKPLADIMKVFITVLEKMGQIPTGIADMWRTQLDSIKQNVTQARADIKGKIEGLTNDITNVLQNGKGTWAENLDTAAKMFQDFLAKLKGLGSKGSQDLKQTAFQWTSFWGDTVKKLASQMETTLGNFFYNTLTGQVQSAKELFADFGRAIIQILTQALAKLILFYAVGKMFESYFPAFGNPFGSFHNGGVIRKAHSGMLASDEMPIIAQTDEGVLSRKGMSALGRENFDRLNKGYGVGGGGQTIYLTQVIQAWDARDVHRNRKTLANGLIEELRANGAFRGAIRQYT